MTTPDSVSTAAWGDPPIVYRCGVDRPTTLQTTSSLVEVDGVSWLPVRLTNGYVFTTVTPPYLEIRVPAAYSPEATVLVDFSAVARAAEGT